MKQNSDLLVETMQAESGRVRVGQATAHMLISSQLPDSEDRIPPRLPNNPPRAKDPSQTAPRFLL